ncbi:MAG TPA: FtsX-like permease family protein [Micromonosporaceae bacterium]|nr:FtsX-like permease family protein [Micromonosporaceae bacterium]
MIRFGLRLAVAGGREAVGRLVTIAAAVAVGVALLLAALAGVNAVNTQNARYAWLNTGPAAVSARSGVTRVGPAAPDPAWWLVREDYYHGRTIGRVDVAVTGPDSPVPPGMTRLPGPGEYYASPALADLISGTPVAQLADRFPGHRVGTIGAAALPSPDSLVIVVGRTVDDLSHLPGATEVNRVAAVSPSNCFNCFVGVNASGITLILSVVAAALLFPLLIFVGAATRLNAARREQRFAAMRLVGATPRQVTVLSTVESTVAAVAGTALGFALFALIRNPLSAIPFTGDRFYPGDLTLGLVESLLVAVGVPVGAAVAARLALRRVRISPLGVARRVTPKPPSAYRLIPALVGVVELNHFIGNRPQTTNGQVAAYLTGIFLIMGGLVIAGPWLTMVGSRAMARLARRPAALISARRLADNPQAGFRAVSGLMLALFVTSTAIGVITSIVNHEGTQASGSAATVMSARFAGNQEGIGRPTSLPADLAARLHAVPGVLAIIPVHDNPLAAGPVAPVQTVKVPAGTGAPVIQGELDGVVSCADLAAAPELGTCASGAGTASVWPDFQRPGREAAGPWPTSALPAAQLGTLPLLAVDVSTDGSTATLEQVRTVFELAYPGSRIPPATENDFRSDSTKLLAQYQQLADVVILASLPIAGCSLAASLVGGLTERRRPFSLLRLTGVPLRVLRRVVALENAVPLLLVAVVAVGFGLLAADLFLRAQMGYPLRPPSAGFYAVVLAGIVASLGIIASGLPVLARITGPETARND